MFYFDLVKAFDKVPRIMLWAALAKFGIPKKLIDLIIALHTDIQVDFEFQGVKKSFFSHIGVKQGDVLGPILFNFYIAAIMITWRKSTSVNACVFKTSQDFRLTGRNPNNLGTLFYFRDSSYADDTAVAFTSRVDTDKGTCELINHFSKWGMTIHTGSAENPSKSEIVRYNLHPNDCIFPDMIFCPNNSYIPIVSEFCYLGSIICHTLNDKVDVINRIKKAGNAYGALKTSIFNNQKTSINSKSRIYCAMVIPIALYGSENWCTSVADERRLETFHHNCIRHRPQNFKSRG